MNEWPTKEMLTGVPVYIVDFPGVWIHEKFVEGLSPEDCRHRPYPHFDVDAASFDALKEKL